MFVANFKILGQVEIFDRKKKFTQRDTNTQTNIVMEKTKTIYPYVFRMQGV